MAYEDLTPEEKQEITDYWDLYRKIEYFTRQEDLYGLDEDERYEFADLQREMKERFDE